MIDYTPTFTDITKWNINVHQSTGGTRSKSIASQPNTGIQFFFKGSKETVTGEIRYPTEFWSEIVASKIGAFLGFNMLDYNIAYNETHRQKIGCLSKSMIVSGENKLTEGVNYLVGYDGSYRPELAEHKKKYNIDFITATLESFSMRQYVAKIVEIIIFDSIVGNSDRHQENWGIITNFRSQVAEGQIEKSNIWERLTRKMLEFMTNLVIVTSKLNPKVDPSTLRLEAGILPHDFAPIYDSGCCLGREILDEKVQKMLKNDQMIEAYVRKGQSEVHYSDLKKKNHFELIKCIKTNHSEYVLSIIQRTKGKYNSQMISTIINGIDQELPASLSKHKLVDDRKDLMVKLVTLRLESLFNII